MKRLRSLRVLFPLGVLVAVTVAIAFTACLGLLNAERDVFAAAQGALARDSHRLAAFAQRVLLREPGWLADDVARWANDRRAVAAAVIAPDGQILHASKLAWVGRQAQEVLPRHTQAALASTRTQRDVQYVESRQEERIALLGFDAPESGATLRPQRGAIYLEFDLTQVLAEERSNALKTTTPVLVAFLLLSLFLLEVVDRVLTGPLARLLQAVDEFSNGRRDTPLRLEGAPEVRALTAAFAGMRDAVDLSLADLERQQQHLSAAQGIAHLGSWEWQRGDDSGWWTDEVYALLGVVPGEISPLPESILLRVHPQDRDRMRRLYDEAIQLRMPVSADYRLLRADGRECVLHDEVQPVADSEGAIIGLRGTLQDISERTAIERAWRRSEEENRLILESTLDAVITIDAEGNVCHWNSRAEATFGWSAAEALGQPMHSLIMPERLHAAHLRGMHTYALTGEGPVLGRRIELPALHRQGHELTIEISIASLGVHGERRYSAFLRDISERKRVDAQLHALNESLESRIGERTAELSQAKEDAERASAAKSEFLSRMSHELRTPMNAVLGFSQLLRSDDDAPLSEEQAGAVDEILMAGKHLLGLIDEILDLARVESGRLDLDLEPVDPAQAISEAMRLLQPLAERQQVRLQSSLIDAGGAALLADRRRLRQVLINLLSNAIKYNRLGGSAGIRCGPGPAGMLRVSVDDSGVGINADGIERLFRPFERLESAYSGIEGTGIGLALCKRLVESMHGQIGVDSRVGEGSSFWFELPLALATSIDVVSDISELPAPEPSARRRVLYVEDNPANLRLMHKLFAGRPQWELIDAHDGMLALDVINTQALDLVMLDIGLPGMDGFELLQRLRAVRSADALPAIAVSANASERDIERGMAAGFTAYFTKPIDVARLLVCIDTLLVPAEAHQP